MLRMLLLAALFASTSSGLNFGLDAGIGIGGGGPHKVDDGCPYACPPGWNQLGYTEHCYLLPTQPAKLDTFWNHQARCKKAEPTSYIAVVDSPAEQVIGSAVAFQYAANWFAVLTNGFIWLGGYTTPQGWKFLDGTDQSNSILMIGSNLLGSRRNFTCLGADPKTLGLWQTRPCSDTTGTAICEMPKRRVCGPTGGMIPLSNVNLSPSQWHNLFPHLPSIPYIGQFGQGNLI